MKTKKGFTLIELIVVIALLSILVVLSVPKVINIFNAAKKKTFMNQVQNIYSVAENQSSKDEIEGKKKNYYSNASNSLDLENLENINYYIEIENGKLSKIQVSDGNYSISSEGENLSIDSIAFADIKANGEAGYLEGEDIGPSKIYGVSWNGSGSALTRTDNSVGKSYEIKPDGTIESDFDTAQIYEEMTEETDAFGNKFIKIPKFYIKKTVNGNNWTWQISKKKWDSDYYLPACFKDEDTAEEYQYILVGKYDASLSAGNKLESKSGKMPYYGTIINDFRNYAKANGTGYQLLDIHIVDILQVLFYIEFANLDSSSIMPGFSNGQKGWNTIVSLNGTTLTLSSGIASSFRVGQMISIGTSVDAPNRVKYARVSAINGNTLTYELIPGLSTTILTVEADHYVYNEPYLNGITDTVATPSGSYGDNTSGKYPMKYRGIENLYAQIDQYVDGINLNSCTAYVARDAKDYASNVFNGEYSQIGYTIPVIEGICYIKKLGYDSNKPFINLLNEFFISSEVANSPYKDSYKCYNGNRVAVVGGNYVTGVSSGAQFTGLSTWDFSYSTSTYPFVSSRLVKTP